MKTINHYPVSLTLPDGVEDEEVLPLALPSDFPKDNLDGHIKEQLEYFDGIKVVRILLRGQFYIYYDVENIESNRERRSKILQLEEALAYSERKAEYWRQRLEFMTGKYYSDRDFENDR